MLVLWVVVLLGLHSACAQDGGQAQPAADALDALFAPMLSHDAGITAATLAGTLPPGLSAAADCSDEAVCEDLMRRSIDAMLVPNATRTDGRQHASRREIRKAERKLLRRWIVRKRALASKSNSFARATEEYLRAEAAYVNVTESCGNVFFRLSLGSTSEDRIRSTRLRTGKAVVALVWQGTALSALDCESEECKSVRRRLINATQSNITELLSYRDFVFFRTSIFPFICSVEAAGDCVNNMMFYIVPSTFGVLTRLKRVAENCSSSDRELIKKLFTNMDEEYTHFRDKVDLRGALRWMLGFLRRKFDACEGNKWCVDRAIEMLQVSQWNVLMESGIRKRATGEKWRTARRGTAALRALFIANAKPGAKPLFFGIGLTVYCAFLVACIAVLVFGLWTRQALHEWNRKLVVVCIGLVTCGTFRLLFWASQAYDGINFPDEVQSMGQMLMENSSSLVTPLVQMLVLLLYICIWIGVVATQFYGAEASRKPMKVLTIGCVAFSVVIVVISFVLGGMAAASPAQYNTVGVLERSREWNIAQVWVFVLYVLPVFGCAVFLGVVVFTWYKLRISTPHYTPRLFRMMALLTIMLVCFIVSLVGLLQRVLGTSVINNAAYYIAMVTVAQSVPLFILLFFVFSTWRSAATKSSARVKSQQNMPLLATADDAEEQTGYDY